MTLFKKGSYVADKNSVFYFRKNGKKYNRLGIMTGKKVGNAVARSRCRRIIRAAYTQNMGNFPVGYDIVAVARVGTPEAKSTEISKFIVKRVIPAMNKPPKKQVKR